jgi:hypothetical protein
MRTTALLPTADGVGRLEPGARPHRGFDFDDHTKAVAEYKRHESMATAELEALFNRQ